jgi:trigger factor
VKVSVEKSSENSEAVLQIDLSWDELEKASDKAYRKLVRKIDVQGFRRGKAPRSIVERKVGKEYIYQEGLDDLITETYRNAIKDYDLHPIAQPELDAPVFEMGQPYHFTLKVPVLTPVELGDYRALHFEREEASVTSEEVEKELENLRQRQATWTEVERPAEYGDRVTVDLKLTVEEKSISDLKDNPFELTHERFGLFSGMDEHIVGMQSGESKEFTTTIPEDYSNDKIAGKEARYAVTLYKVEVKEMPELDDAFAAKISNGQFETMEDLRKVVSDELQDTKERRIREELRERVINAVVDESQVTLHPTLIHEQAEDILHRMTHLLEQQRMSLDQFLMLSKKTREEYLDDMLPDAERELKQQLVLDAVADKEDITVTSDEIDALLQAYAETGQQIQGTEAQRNALSNSYRREKTISRLLELTTDSDEDAESIDEEISIDNAEAAAEAGDALATEDAEIEAIAARELAEASASAENDEAETGATASEHAETGAQS